MSHKRKHMPWRTQLPSLAPQVASQLIFWLALLNAQRVDLPVAGGCVAPHRVDEIGRESGAVPVGDFELVFDDVLQVLIGEQNVLVNSFLHLRHFLAALVPVCGAT